MKNMKRSNTLANIVLVIGLLSLALFIYGGYQMHCQYNEMYKLLHGIQ